MNLFDMSVAMGLKGFLHCDELQLLAELAVNRDALEIGAFCGLSAWAMAITAKSVLSVDTFSAATDGQRQTDALTTLDAYRAAVSRFRNTDYRVATSEDAFRLWGGDFDMIFIDAGHTYDDVHADVTRWWPRVRHGGVLVCHDYGAGSYPGVKEAIDDLFGLPQDGDVLVTLRTIHKPL